MGACCSALVHVNTQEWAIWADHPVRQDYDVIMDLGEGAFSLASGRFSPKPSIARFQATTAAWSLYMPEVADKKHLTDLILDS